MELAQKTARVQGIIPLAVALMAVVVFLNALGNRFVWDDNDLIVDNPTVHSLSSLPRFFQSHFWSQSDQPSARGYFRPLILLSYAFDYTLWGPNPLGFHITNVIWHALASVMVCLLVMRLTSSNMASLFAGTVFALHPVHVESVAFISGRTDVIATALALISIYLFLDVYDAPKRIVRIACAPVFFGLALLAKEVAIIVPPLLLLSEVIEPQRRNRRLRITIHTLFWLILALYLVARFAVLKIVPHVQGHLNLTEWLYTMPLVLTDYARLLIAPIRLCADYAVKVRHTADLLSLVAIFLVGLAGGLTAFLIARRKLVGFLAAWILLGLLPVLQIVPISVLKAERFLYMSSVGFCALAGVAVSSMYENVGITQKKVIAIGFALIILSLSIRTTLRNTVWKNEFALYKATALCAPDNFRVQYNLGNAYFRAGDLAQALSHTERAFRLRPDFPQVCYNLGVMYTASNRPQDAATMYLRAIELDPGYALAHNNLAVLYYAAGRFEDARTEWLKALALAPGLESAREGLDLLEHNP